MQRCTLRPWNLPRSGFTPKPDLPSQHLQASSMLPKQLTPSPAQVLQPAPELGFRTPLKRKAHSNPASAAQQVRPRRYCCDLGADQSQSPCSSSKQQLSGLTWMSPVLLWSPPSDRDPGRQQMHGGATMQRRCSWQWSARAASADVCWQGRSLSGSCRTLDLQIACGFTAGRVSAPVIGKQLVGCCIARQMIRLHS